MVRKEQPLNEAIVKGDGTGLRNHRLSGTKTPNLSNATSVMALGKQQCQHDTLEGAVRKERISFVFNCLLELFCIQRVNGNYCVI